MLEENTQEKSLKRTLADDNGTLVVTFSCDCHDEEVIYPDVDTALNSDNSFPDLYVRQEYADESNLTSDPSFETGVQTIAKAGSNDDLSVRCPECECIFTTSAMQGKTGSDGGNRPAIFIEASLSSASDGLVCVALDDMLFECSECNGTAPRATVVKEGPDAPEYGWQYCECPSCGDKSHISAMK